MPEGHTLFRLATSLRDAFAGDAVRVSSPQGRFEESAAVLDGLVLHEARSFGKHLFVEFEQDRQVHGPRGLDGQFPGRRGRAPAPGGRVRVRRGGPAARGRFRGGGLGGRRQRDARPAPSPARRGSP